MSREQWITMMCQQQPQFHYLNETLQLVLDTLLFVRAIREANFVLYCHALVNIAPLFFAFDHVNYARWATVHLRDLLMLERSHPILFEEFKHGHFTVRKSMHKFSSISLDHAHEQENAKVKGDGGASGLFQDEKALHRWMVGGPELSRLVQEFEIVSESAPAKTCTGQHEQGPTFQSNFKHNVKSLISQIDEMGNPFIEESGSLFALDIMAIMKEM